MARSRERGTGSVYLKEDPNNPGQKLQTWWISYYIDGKRKRESSKSRKKSDAQALLKRRMGEHALGLELGDEAKRLTFEDLETGFRRSYENSGRRSLRRAGNAWDHLREHFGCWKARAITANALELRTVPPAGFPGAALLALPTVSGGRKPDGDDISLTP